MFRRHKGRSMHAWVPGVAAAAVLAMAVSACGAGSSGGGGASAGPIKLGAMLALTGDQAGFQTAIKHAIQLADSDVNASGGVNGRKLQIVFEDSKGTPQGGITAFNKLVKSDGINNFITLSSPVVAAILPLAERNQTAMLDIATLSPSIWTATKNRQYTFSTYPKSDFEATQNADYLYNKRGIRRAAVLAVDSETGQVPGQTFAKHFKELGGQIVAEQYYPSGTTDFSNFLSQIARAKPQIVDVVCNEECGLIVRQAAQEGQNLKWVGASTMANPDFVHLAGKASDGVLVVAAGWNPGSSAPPVKKFVAEYRKKYNEEPTVYAAYGYDAVQIFAKAMRDAGSNDPDAVAKALKGINYSGATGTTTLGDDGLSVKPIYVQEVKNGKFHIIKTIAPPAQ